jgi:hypothetical protein
MYNKNILQNGEKTTDSIISVFSPATVVGRNQTNVDVQQGNTQQLLLNKDSQLPRMIIDNNKIYSIKENETAKEKYNKLIKDSEMIDFNKRKPMTFEGMDVDFAMPILDVVEFAIEVAQRGLLPEDAESINIIASIIPDLKEYREKGKVTDVLAQVSNALKDSFYVDLKQASTTYYYSDLYTKGSLVEEQMKNVLNTLEIIPKLSLLGPEESMNFMKGEVTKYAGSIYETIKADDYGNTSRTSKNAKERLLNNPWYVGYVETVKDTQPELYQLLIDASQNEYITDEEAKIIGEISRNAEEVSRQKQIIEDQFGWETMNNLFSNKDERGASLNDLIDMKWEVYKTVLDDEIQDSVKNSSALNVDYDKYFDSNIMMTSAQKDNLTPKTSNNSTQGINTDNIGVVEKEVGLDIDKEKYNAKMDSSIEAYQMGMIDRAEVNRRRFER